MSEKAITCANDNKLCENGKARIKLPGQCCKVCSKYLCYCQIKTYLSYKKKKNEGARTLTKMLYWKILDYKLLHRYLVRDFDWKAYITNIFDALTQQLSVSVR